MHGIRNITRKILNYSLDRNASLTCLAVRKMSGETSYDFETLKVSSPREDVAHVELNRPDRLNAMNIAFWRECRECFQKLATDKNYRVIIVSGAGRLFTAGLDLMDMGDVMPTGKDVARNCFKIRPKIEEYQESFTSIEKCPKPVIAAVHGGCIGGGVDLTSACDIRYCTQDAWFQIKEIDVGLTADVGTLQRLPKIVGNDSLARELCYTARKFHSDEAKDIGFVSRIFPDKAAMINAAIELASLIASKSPVAVQGTKVSMVYSRDHSVPEGLAHIALWNQAMLQSEDVMKSAEAMMQKKEPKFSKL
ncbi:delta(3,5)-Delta(2,4)-dienoyl-CoA isomerase, mitochondrial-like isoform X1 [Mytilus galloprovincialis]|uniref:delta(3,5)-Delta(2,4)-dienoyl-CoA isomerase, mitochondrial-like isoform X1 n=2 Tax=Mytilus galloprovincialis TaxID=29158 RepID=UPI003F7BE973